ncbi:EAL domain-containing protein [Nitrosophilus labii]|uniref:EAL domain-containing protein n=1 Tax=Nitrosophilus labii TaxID=2706014 RepID=UPI00165692B3|nr:EAL domain-containing protein [Nitrosophilus labii]
MKINNLKLKLIFIFLVPAIGMIYFSSQYVYEKFEQYLDTKYLEKGVEYTKSSTLLIKELQKERGLSISSLISDNVDFQKRLKRQIENTEDAFKRYKKSLFDFDYVKDDILIKDILKKYKKIYEFRKKVEQKNISIFEILDFYSDIVSELIDSTNILNRRFINETFFKYIISFKDILKLSEISGKERALISYFLESKNQNVVYRLMRLESEFEEIYKRFKNEAPIRIVVIYQNIMKYKVENSFQKLKKKIVFENIYDISAIKWWELSTKYIDNLYKISNAILDTVLYLKGSLKKDAIYYLIISLVLWISSIVALYGLIYIITKLLEKFEEFVSIIEREKKLYKIFAEFSETIIYHQEEKTILNSLSYLLFKTEKFKYIWIGEVKKDRVEPILSDNISIDIIKKEEFLSNPPESKLLNYVEKAIKSGNYNITTPLKKNSILYEDVESLAIFPIYRSSKIEYVLIIAATKESAFDAKIIDLINKMVNALSFALEKIEIQKEEEKLKEELKIASYAFNTHEAITITDIHGKIIRVNDAFTRITGYSKDEVIGKNPSILKSGKHDKAFYTEMWDKIRKDGYWKGEIYNKRKNGEIYPEMLSISAVKNDNGEVTHYIAHFFDISDLKEAQKSVEHRAYHDPLTDVFNRQKLLDELKKIYKEAKRKGFYNAFLFIDLDNFKHINDYYNHEIGDKVLIEFVKRLKKIKKESDIVARIAGDEFAYIAYNISDDKSLAIKKASILVEKIKDIFSETLDIEGHRIELSFSIGIKIFPDNENSFKDVIVNADIAMYHAKKNGKNQFYFFNEALDIESKQFLIVKNELTQAIKSREIILHYQPKVTVNDNKVVGFEALVRWDHPKKGLLYPDQFLYVTSGNRLVFDLGDYVLKEVCNQIKLWEEEFENFDKKISINISAEQFNHQNFEKNVKKILKECDIDPKYLEFEIVEDALLKNGERAIKIINRFKKIGINFSIDDFGKGYSSINYLKTLPVDYIKIDRDFVIDIFKDKNREIVKMIIQTSKIFGLKTVAEGIEKEETLGYLKDIGCDLYQGFYFSRPLSPSQIKKFLR